MRFRRRAAEHELDIRHRKLGPRLDESVQPARHHRAGAGAEEVGADHADRHAVAPHLLEKRAFVQALEKDDHREVVLQVLTDRQIDHGLDVHRSKMRRRTDPRTHQQRRGIERTAREDHLPVGLDPHHIPAALVVFDAGRARALHQHASRVRTGRYVEVCPLLRRSEIGGRGR